MFSDGSTFTLMKGVPKVVPTPNGSSRYDRKFTAKTMKHASSVIMWGAFRGNLGRADLYFLPKNVTKKESFYVNVLKEHLVTFCRIHQCNHFMHDCVPAHKLKVEAKFLNNHNIHVLE